MPGERRASAILSREALARLCAAHASAQHDAQLRRAAEPEECLIKVASDNATEMCEACAGTHGVHTRMQSCMLPCKRPRSTCSSATSVADPN